MSSRANRIFHYIHIMFPPAVLIPLSIVKFFVVYFSFQLLFGITELTIGLESIAGAITLTGFTLLARVYDELKDVEADIRLGQAGDPRYADRPIVTGAVLVEDILFLRNTLIAILFIANLWLQPIALAGFAFAFAFIWLSSKWFFYPKISESLLLALLTHNPLVLVIQCYVLALTYSLYPQAQLSPLLIPLMLGLWLPMAGWEISRKQRIPEDETDYETYSRMWGWKISSLVAPILFVSSSALLIFCGIEMNYPDWWVLVLLGATVVPVAAGIRFRLRPSTQNSHLQPFSESYIAICDTSILVAQILTFGTIWP